MLALPSGCVTSKWFKLEVSNTLITIRGRFTRYVNIEYLWGLFSLCWKLFQTKCDLNTSCRGWRQEGAADLKKMVVPTGTSSLKLPSGFERRQPEKNNCRRTDHRRWRQFDVKIVFFNFSWAWWTIFCGLGLRMVNSKIHHRVLLSVTKICIH